MTFKERLILIFTGKRPAREPAAAAVPPAPAQEPELPGDFQSENADLISNAERLGRAGERLWTHEAVESDSKHPQRKKMAEDIARQWAELRESSKQFYRQWRVER